MVEAVVQMFVMEVRGPASPKVWGGGGDMRRLCEVCWWCHITRLLASPLHPLRKWVRPDRREPNTLGRSFIFVKGKNGM